MNTKGFSPLIESDAKVLILGTMPGKQSLERNQYYASPNNGFWEIISDLFPDSLMISYEEKQKILIRNHVALWDVLQYCEREGSLDININTTTLIANDFRQLFNTYKNLEAIFFNGVTAYELFHLHVMESLKTKVKIKLAFIPLPSSSSANTHKTQQEKANHWRIILHYTKSK